MNKLINILIPTFDWLYILQTLEYRSWDFLKWIFLHYFCRDLQKKKKLTWTSKIIAIFSITFLAITFYLITSFSFLSLINSLTGINILIEIFIGLQLSFLYILVANLILEPIDDLLKIIYISQAQRILEKQPKLLVIGITGSYGKTSTKEILYQILSSRYQVLKTPSSFNTVLGVAQIIKKELKEKHEIFIVEMGAYKKGEIRKICNLVKPRIGIITGINEQHLDRFKTIKNTLKAKTELIDSLPSNGIVALNFDNQYLHQYYQNKLQNQKKLKVLPYSVMKESSWRTEKIVFNIQNIEDSEGDPPRADRLQIGTKFEIPFSKKKYLKLQSPLLGEHNVLNIMGALAIAKQLHIPIEQFPKLVSDLKPIEHRLQIIPTTNGITVIDDAYSGNPNGFKAALDVLGQFENHRKIIVTPGIVELGKKEKEIHEKLGQKTGEICDVVILIGKNPRTNALISGIHQTKFDPKNLYLVKSLNEAQTKITEISQIGDVIMFENDLPDQY